ncbi:MAG: HAD family hydrolase [Armatimonadetes bacterium]|nr:HAD family hydrolase [Armatimonadota bacterium]
MPEGSVSGRGADNPPVNSLLTSAWAVLFDLDGTLVDTRLDFDRMRIEMRRLSAWYGASATAENDILLIVESAFLHLRSECGEEIAERFREAAFSRLAEIEAPACNGAQLVTGAADLIRGLKARNAAVGVVTRNSRSISARMLDDCGLEVDVLLTRDDVPRVKPDPDHLLTALKALKNRFPDERRNAVMIGDHWMDVKAGKAAGLKAVGVLRGRDPTPYNEAGADLLVQELVELLG